jgi:hypothetical protein
VAQTGGQIWGSQWMGKLRGENRGSLWRDSTDSPVGGMDVNSADTILYSYTLSFFMSTPKRSGWCRRCDHHLRDLLDHIKKQHPNDKFTHRDIKDSTLIVCPCGRVVLNHVGLIKHRLRYGCVKAPPRPSIRDSSPLTSPSLAASAAHRPLRSSSSLSSAPPSSSALFPAQHSKG